MSQGISQFKGQFSGGGARPNLFKVAMQFPGSVGVNAPQLSEYLIKAASLPGSVVGEINVPYRGRKMKIAGDRTFANWTVTIYNDTDMFLRNAFESWMSLIGQNAANISTASPALDGYMVDLAVYQLDRQEQVTKSYKFIDAWPVNIQDIPLDFDTNDAIEEFTVEFAYQYWVSPADGQTI